MDNDTPKTSAPVMEIRLNPDAESYSKVPSDNVESDPDLEVAKKVLQTPEAKQEGGDPSTKTTDKPEEVKKVEGAKDGKEVAENDKKTVQRLAHAAKREADLKKREAAIAAREKEIEEKSSSVKGIEDLRKEAKANPTKFMEEFGITYDEITRFILNDNKPTEKTKVELLEEQLLELKSKLTQSAEEAQQAENQRLQADIDRKLDDYKVRLKGYINARPNDYELVIANDAYEVVYEAMVEHFNQHEVVPESPDEIIKMVEDYLFDEVKKISGSKKLRALIGVEEKKQEQPKGEEKPKTTTLTNAGFAAAAVDASGKLLSKEESLDRIKKTLVWN